MLNNALARLPRSRPLLMLVVGAAVVGLAGFAPIAQGDEACFPETGFCVGGRFRTAWESGGGLPVFGYPITPPQTERVEGQPRTVQWFERARFELRPELPAPADVQLGRLGDERLRRDGRDWRRFLPPQPQEGCRTFAETGHAVCGDLLAAWQGHGAMSDAESLALWGLPLSEAQIEQLVDGQSYAVQWFERARFEIHPENEPPFRVLFGLLGRELGPVAQRPEPSPTAAPALAPPLPTAHVARSAGRAGAAPARIAIPAIGLDRAILPVGVDAAGEFEVPPHDVGWYEYSAAPGGGENIVLWGHVLPFLSAPQIPPPFAGLSGLDVGARITLYDAAGRPRAYVVTRRIRVAPEEVGYVMPQGRELLTLVSCIGEGVVVGGATVDMSQRLITIAEPLGR